MAEADEKRLNKVLFRILLVLGLVIVGLGAGIIIIYAQRKNDAMIPEEEWATVLGECIYNFDTTEVDCASFKSDLKKIIDNPSNEDIKVTAGISLSTLCVKDDINSAINLLEDIYSDNLSDQNKYRVLKVLAAYYKDNNKLEYAKKIREIIKLPDSMRLEYEDWELVKAELVSELELIEQAEVDNETE